MHQDDDMTDPTVRPASKAKKTEMIEVRVSHETKRDFLAACQRANRTASDVIREAVDDFVAGRKSPGSKKARVLALIPKPLRKKSYLAAGAAMAGLATFAVLPSAAAPGVEASFKALDTNGDGAISHEEFMKQAAGTKRLEVKPVGKPAAAARGAGDGAIYFLPGDGAKAGAGLRDVVINHLSPPTQVNPEEARAARFASFDTNGDGKLDLAEYSSREAALATNGFRKLDTNGDGSLDPAEYGQLNSNMIVYPADAEGYFSTNAKFGPPASSDALKAEFDRLDADKNGKLSLQEYLPAR
jgi:Ca2+-binding EF-hand superfamily protein